MKKRKFEDWEFEQIQKEFGYSRYYDDLLRCMMMS